MPLDQISWSKTSARMVYGVRNPKGPQNVVFPLSKLHFIRSNICTHFQVDKLYTCLTSPPIVFRASSHRAALHHLDPLFMLYPPLVSPSTILLNWKAICVRVCQPSPTASEVFCTSLSLSYLMKLNPCYRPYMLTLVVSPPPVEHFIYTSSYDYELRLKRRPIHSEYH